MQIWKFKYNMHYAVLFRNIFNDNINKVGSDVCSWKQRCKDRVISQHEQWRGMEIDNKNSTFNTEKKCVL